VPVDSRNCRASGKISPDAVWPRACTVIVLAIRTLGNSKETKTLEESILNILAYRLAVWLNSRRIASICLPRLDKTAWLFSHESAASMAGLKFAKDGCFNAISVLTSFGVSQ
jgi:hypothetical protein